MRLPGYNALKMLLPIKVWIASCVICIGVAFESLLPLVFLALGMLLAHDAFPSRRGWKRTPVDYAILLLVLLLPVNLLISPLPAASISSTLRLLSGIFYYYILSNSLSTNQHYRVVLILIAVLCLGLSMLAWVTVDWQMYKPSTGIATPEFISRLQIAERVHPNVMAGNLTILISVLLGTGLFAWGKFAIWEKVPLLAAGLSGTLIILQSGSRGALLALGIAVGLALLLRRRLLGVSYFLLTSAAGVAFVVSLIAANAQGDMRVDGRAVSLALRLEIWARTLDMLRDSPLTGVGMGVFGSILDKLYPLFLSSPGTILHAHNLYLQIAVDLGLPGLIAWLAILLIAAWTCWKSFREAPPGSLRSGFAAGLLAAQAALSAHGLFDAVTWGIVRTAPLVWALWGLAIALQSTTRKAATYHAECK